VKWYGTLGEKEKPIWAMAVNFRYVKSLLYAAEQVASRVDGRLADLVLECRPSRGTLTLALLAAETRSHELPA